VLQIDKIWKLIKTESKTETVGLEIIDMNISDTGIYFRPGPYISDQG